MRTLVVTYPSIWHAIEPTSGKFVQLRLDDRDVLLFAAATECHYHNEILGRFLADQAVSHRWRGRTDLVFEHAGLAVTGGGRFRLDPARRTLRLWDASGVYGPFDATRLVAQLAAAGGPWTRLGLEVE